MREDSEYYDWRHFKLYYKNYTSDRRQVYACGSTDVLDKLSQSKTLQSTTSCRLTTGSIIKFYWRLKEVIQEFKTGWIKANKKYVLDKDRHTSTSASNHGMSETCSHIRIPATSLVLCSEHCGNLQLEIAVRRIAAPVFRLPSSSSSSQ